MKEKRFGVNFRFSSTELQDLDDLVKEININRGHYLFWREPTRTDVLRYLIRQEKGRLETAARQKLEAELAAVKKKPAPRKAKKKGAAA